MPERVLTLRELNRTVLLRQLLLRRERVGVVRAVERLAGLQSQSPPSPYVALWSRVEGFERRALERALLSGRVVRALLMRATIHTVSARDLPFFDAAVRDARTVGRVRGASPPPPEAVERIVALTRERALTRSEIMRALGYDPRTANVQELRTYSWVLALGRLERTPDAGLWSFRGQPAFAPARHELAPEPDATAHLVRRYLAAFGPATRADLSQWSGMTVRDLSRGLEALRLRTFRDERGRELLDLPRAPLAPADAPAPRLLPRWDELLLAHADRTRVLPEEYRSTVIHKNGDVQQTFLVDGFVGGLWREERGRIVLDPFGRLPRTARAELEDEARRLEAWLR